MHPFQAGQRFQINRVAAHRQILPLDHRKAQIARQISVFKIGFVVRPWRQQHDMRTFAGIGRRPVFETFLHLPEKRSEMLRLHVAEQFRKHARHDHPVFQRVTRAGRRLRAVGNHPPTPIRRTRQIDGVMMQKHLARRTHPDGRPEKTMLSIYQRWRQQPLGKQFLRPVQIREDGIQQAGALRHRLRQALPLIGRQNQRQRVKRPGTVVPLMTIGINIVGNAVFLNGAIDEFQPLAHRIRRDAIQMDKQVAPMRAHPPIGIQHLVVTMLGARVNRKKGTCHAGLR